MKAKLGHVKSFIQENMVLILVVIFGVVLCYGKHAITTNIGIDTEQYVLGIYGKDWVIEQLGRFGHYYSIMLLNLWHYNPYMNGIAFLIIFSLAILAWCYTFYMISGNTGKWRYLLFSIIFMTSPLWATQFYFSLQQGAIALLFQAVSFISLFDFLLYGKENSIALNVIELIISLLLATYAIGTYQSFPGLHLTEAAACLLLMFDRMTNDESLQDVHKCFWKKTGIVVVHFLVSYCAYMLICKVMKWGTSDYLQVKWGKKPVREIIGNLYRDFKNIVFGKDVYAGYILLVSLILLLILVVKFFLSKKNIWLKFDYIIMIIGNVICMIALNIVIGGIPADRARLPVTFTVAFLGMYSFYMIWKMLPASYLQKMIVLITGIVMVISIGSQLERSQTLFYTDDICNMQQYEVGADIIHEIGLLGGNDQANVIFVGKWVAPLNPSCLRQGPIGASSFEWDYQKKKPTNGSRRACLYLCAAFGKQYNVNYDKKTQKAAKKMAKDMPCYPSEGYIQKIDDTFVIKLSN